MDTVKQMYNELIKRLISRKITLTTMESCTGGFIASLITNNDGVSEIFKGSFVTYCNEAKIMHGVPSEIIEKYGVYSKETAQSMASACKKIYKTDIGIGITGSLGNIDPNNSDSVLGEVYYAIDYKNINSYFIKIPKQKTRLDYKIIVAKNIADKLLNI